MLEEKFLFECDICKKVFLCSGECPVSGKKVYAPEGIGCICDKCTHQFNQIICETEKVSDPRLILLAKLKKGVWIKIRRKKK